MNQRDAVEAWDVDAAAFDDAADHGLRDPAVRAAWRDLLLGVLPPAPVRVADMGCGTATLAVLLADEGYLVDGVDFSPAMIELARTKVHARTDITITIGDVAAPPLEPATYDVVLCRHVLWALVDQQSALRSWIDLLRSDGRLVLIEGNWATGAGMTADRTVALLADVGRMATVTRLDNPSYWGREISDERYVVLSTR